MFGLFFFVNGQKEHFYIYHQAVEGETFKSLEKIYGVSQEVIRDANPSLSWKLKTGDSVRIPYQKELLSNPSQTQTNKNNNISDTIFYEVSSKETLYGISRKFNITIDQLIAANPILKAGLKSGQVIIIPKGEVAIQEIVPPLQQETNSSQHTVQAGETMYSIAKAYRVNLDSLSAANPQIINYQISIGTVLNIPQYVNVNDYIEYKTHEKEALSKIAFKYQVPIQSLKNVNPSFSKTVPEGKTVKIPVASYEEFKEQNLPSQETIEPPIVEETMTTTANHLCFNDWNTNAVFKIAVMMPFKLDQFNSSELQKEMLIKSVDDYSFFTFFQFYQSVVLALEHLIEKGLHFELYVYDVVACDSKLNTILQSSQFQKVDLIIGFLYKDPFSKVAEFAKKHDIVLINVNSNRDNVVENYPNVVKVLPDIKELAKASVSILPDTLMDFNLILSRNKGSEFLEEEQNLRSAIAQKYGVYHYSDSTVFGKYDIVKKLKKNKPNYIFVFNNDKAYVLDLLRILDKQKNEYDIHVIGYPFWNEITDLDLKYIQNLNTIFITPYLVDFKNSDVVHFIAKFREKYNAEPDQYGYQGYDITNFFVEGLAKFGKDFLPCINSIEYQPISTKYQFENTFDNGYTNNYWNVYKIQDYEIVRLKN